MSEEYQISMSMNITVPSGVLVRELDAESVLLNLNSEQYFGLDDVGTSILNALNQCHSIQDAFEKVLEEYDVDPDTLKRDMTDLIRKLLKQGLLETVNE